MLLGLTDPGWDPTVLPSKFGEKKPWKYNQAEKPDVFFLKSSDFNPMTSIPFGGGFLTKGEKPWQFCWCPFWEVLSDPFKD